MLDLNVAPAPMVGQSTIVGLDVAALDAHGAGNTEIVLRVPSYFTVTGGTPAGYIVDPGSPPGALGVTDVLWQTSLITGTTQTFTLNVTPLAATAGAFHDEVQAHVHPIGWGRLDGEAEVVYVRAGDASHTASVQEEWPDALALLSQGIPFIPTNGVTLTDIPEMEPLSTDLRWGTFVDASTPVSLQIPIRNTISSMVSFTGTLTLPPGWMVLSGPAAIAGVLAPGQSMLLSYQVLPAQIRCGWTAKLYLRVDAGTIAQCKDDVQLVQQGGLYPCEGPADWLDPGEPAAGRKPYDGAIERVPVRPCQPSPPPCAQCARNVSCPAPATGGSVPAYSSETMTVTGRIFALQGYPDDSYLGNLRLRILEDNRVYPKPAGQGIQPRGMNVIRALAEVRLTACGTFAVCVERVPYFVLEVTATDWISCQQDYSAETLVPHGIADTPSHRWVAYSYPFRPELIGCQWQKNVHNQYVDAWGYTSIQAAAFFPATMIALDMREFMALPAPTSAAVDIGHENYRAHFRYPEAGPDCFEEPPHPTPTGPANACYRSEVPPGNTSGYIYIQEGHAHEMDLVIHEYSHDAHDSLGSGWVVSDTTQFPEGVADFIRGVKEDIGENSCGHHRRGGCYGLPRGLFGCDGIYMEQLPTPPFTSTMNLYTAWLFDAWDKSEDDMTEVPAKCPKRTPPPPNSDRLAIPFDELWNTFATPYGALSTPFPVPARKWVEAWISTHGGTPTWQKDHEGWLNLLTVSLHHGIYNDCDSFPVPAQ